VAAANVSWAKPPLVKLEMQAHHRQIVRLGHSLLRIFMRQHRCPRRVQRRVVVRMVKCQCVSITVFTGALPNPSSVSFSFGHAGERKVSTTIFPSAPCSTSTFPPGR